MYKSTPSAAWCKKRLLVTSLLAAIYQTSAIAADTSAVSGEAVDDTSEQMTVTAPAPVQKAGSEHSISAQELEDKGANDFGSIMRYEPLISATGASTTPPIASCQPVNATIGKESAQRRESQVPSAILIAPRNAAPIPSGSRTVCGDSSSMAI
ncbi:hypothetical protein ABN098_20980, partial [Proteus terrae]